MLSRPGTSPRGAALQPDSVTLKRRAGWISSPPRTILDIHQAQNAVSLRDLVPGQPLQLSMLRQSWRIKAGQRVMVIASG
ncbi:flagellar basal body P-ring biosynthesis protein FlgA [Leclercia adecarboxylata]|uniref:Flagellar basal body P-ring biosynthesis protein FlgA n=1 Tax=Leclercia adecarboxylata TaxID=83655 RepID=A0A4U9HQ97_9ENTR|nr:flagellar basal body P-ring biosynthesis protein FlgA [Leclercia adecarboxylata]